MFVLLPYEQSKKSRPVGLVILQQVHFFFRLLTPQLRLCGCRGYSLGENEHGSWTRMSSYMSGAMSPQRLKWHCQDSVLMDHRGTQSFWAPGDHWNSDTGWWVQTQNGCSERWGHLQNVTLQFVSLAPGITFQHFSQKLCSTECPLKWT